MRNELEKEKNDGNSVFITYGCGAHWLNLLGEDITPTSVLKHVMEVQKYFRNHHAPGSWLKECDGHVLPQLPGNTRWNCQLTCLETFERNHTIYLKIANEHYEEMDVNIVNRIRDFNLHRQVKDLIKQLKPISIALDVMQSNSTTLAEACHVWYNLLKNDDLKPHFLKVKKRFEQAIMPCHLVAYLLHPKYRGQLLNYEEKESCKAWLGRINAQFIPYVINFELKGKPYPNSYFTEDVIRMVSAYNWWKSVSKACEISKDFCSLVAHLQICPASSAAIERFFSNFSFVQTKIRNKLSTNTLSKLVYCYAMLKQQKFGCNVDITELVEI